MCLFRKKKQNTTDVKEYINIISQLNGSETNTVDEPYIKLLSEIDMFISSTEDLLASDKGYITPEWEANINQEVKSLFSKAGSITGISHREKRNLDKKIKELDTFRKKFSERVSDHNKAALVSLVDEAKKYVGLVEGSQLDYQQMSAIVKPSRNHLVVAGAGTGKTTTIVGKVKYLLESGYCSEDDILVLSFTNASATEIRERINKETQKYIDAMTFHKLGLDIITKVDGITPNITKVNVSAFAKKYIEDNSSNLGYVSTLCKYLLNRNIDDKSEFDFTNRSEYEEYLHINPPTSVKGETLKSYGEVEIANYLFEHGIEYEYESSYKVDTRTDKYTQYHPDFYLPEYDIYIEYYGIDENGRVPDYYVGKNGDPSSEYKKSMEWKKAIHEENNTILIDTYYYENKQGNLLHNLENNLKKYGVEFAEYSSIELWNLITHENEKTLLSYLADLISTIIMLIKSNNFSFDYVRRIATKKRNEIMLNVVEPIYVSYQKSLSDNGEIDFNDMINKAALYIEQGKYVNPYKYVIVDEYQDISKARFNLLKRLRESADYQLFCVGDDWQSIYRFDGSDIDYIVHFDNYWGATDKSRIESTYRFGDSLIDISGNFVMNNPFQIRKWLVCGGNVTSGFALGEIKANTEKYAVYYMTDILKELPKDSKVYFIGRYLYDVKMIEDSESFSCSYDKKTGYTNVEFCDRKDLSIQFITAHRSKGLQADYVFILNNKDKGMGFPSKIQNDPLVELLLEGVEKYPYAEERRLFYVALTRAKKKVYLLSIDGNESVFTKELEQRYDSQLSNDYFTCPKCGGHLQRRSGQYGEFWGCSNYRNKGCKYMRKISKDV